MQIYQILINHLWIILLFLYLFFKPAPAPSNPEQLFKMPPLTYAVGLC